MIYDKIVNYSRYNFPLLMEKACAHLFTLNENSALGSTQLDGGIRANVDEYTTKLISEGKPEAHRRYIDIQALLSGTEIIGWTPENSMQVSEAYDPQRDIEFYHQEKILTKDYIIPMIPGYFAVFFPWDIHMTQICMDKPELVKKVVYKIPLDIWEA